MTEDQFHHVAGQALGPGPGLAQVSLLAPSSSLRFSFVRFGRPGEQSGDLGGSINSDPGSFVSPAAPLAHETLAGLLSLNFHLTRFLIGCCGEIFEASNWRCADYGTQMAMQQRYAAWPSNQSSSVITISWANSAGATRTVGPRPRDSPPNPYRRSRNHRRRP